MKDSAETDRMSTFLTTEHFTLQGGRNGTISESNGRTSAYLSTVSGGIVALVFVAQLSQAGQIFNLFALVLFPVLLYLGESTDARLVQLAMAD
jgi:hypothetical protein